MGAIGIVARPLSPRAALVAGALISCFGHGAAHPRGSSLRDLVTYLLADPLPQGGALQPVVWSAACK